MTSNAWNTTDNSKSCGTHLGKNLSSFWACLSFCTKTKCYCLMVPEKNPLKSMRNSFTFFQLFYTLYITFLQSKLFKWCLIDFVWFEFILCVIFCLVQCRGLFCFVVLFGDFFLIGLQQGGKLNADSVLPDCRYMELYNFSKNASTS